MVSWIQNFLGTNFASGSVGYYLCVIACLTIFVACGVALVRWLTAPVDMLTGHNKK